MDEDSSLCRFLYAGRPQSPEASFQSGSGRIRVAYCGADRLARLEIKTTGGKKRAEISLRGANEAARVEKRRLSALTLRAGVWVASIRSNPEKVGGAELEYGGGVIGVALSSFLAPGRKNKQTDEYLWCLPCQILVYRAALPRNYATPVVCAPFVHIIHIVGPF